VLKIDIEGAEFKIASQIGEVFREYAPILILSLHPENLVGRSAAQIAKSKAREIVEHLHTASVFKLGIAGAKPSEGTFEDARRAAEASGDRVRTITCFPTESTKR
jgi:hypothetical protein